MSLATAVGIRNLEIALGGRVVLRDITAEIAQGEFIVLLGGNGSGKTTLVRAILGLLPKVSGTIELFGESLERFVSWRKIGYVPQRLALPLSMPATVEEVVMTGRLAHTGLWKRYSSADRTATARAMELTDLEDLSSERVSRLSGGQQQRVLIARALATDPEIIILDEPVSHVDVAHQEQFASLLHKANEDGATIVLVAHALGAMSGLASRAVVLDKGRIAFDGPADQVNQGHEDVHHHDHYGSAPLRPIGGDG